MGSTQLDFVGDWTGALCAGSPPEIQQDLMSRTRAANYRDWSWSTKAGAQGNSFAELEALPPELQTSLDELAVAWLHSAAADDSKTGTEAAKQLDSLNPNQPDGAMGPMEVARLAVAALAKVPLFGQGTYSAVERTNLTALWQVTAYANDHENSKAEVWQRVGAVIDDRTRIMIAHSLGTVVAYEVIHHFGLELDLLLTLGSPLGLDGIIYPKLVPEATFPSTVERWVNVADHDDFVAADPTLAERFPDHAGQGRTIEDIEVRNSGPFIKHHDITEYLKHDEIRAIFWEALGG